MPKFTVQLTQHVVYTETIEVEGIEADDDREAARLAKSKNGAWLEDKDFLNRDHLDVEVQQDGGPTTSWREDG